MFCFVYLTPQGLWSKPLIIDVLGSCKSTVSIIKRSSVVSHSCIVECIHAFLVLCVDDVFVVDCARRKLLVLLFLLLFFIVPFHFCFDQMLVVVIKDKLIFFEHFLFFLR